MLIDAKAFRQTFPEKATSAFKRVITPFTSVSAAMRADLTASHHSFEAGCRNLAILNNPPHPAELIAPMDEQVKEAIGAVTGTNPKDFFSFPSVHQYLYPGSSGFKLDEARRIFTTKPHAEYDDQVVGLHIFSQKGREFYYKVTTFQPRHEPFDLLNRAQTDPDLNPVTVMKSYGLTAFNFDELPPSMNLEVVDALQRTGLL